MKFKEWEKCNGHGTGVSPPTWKAMFVNDVSVGRDEEEDK